MAERTTSQKSFDAILERGDRALGWTIARLPFDPHDLREMIRLRVRGEIEGPKGCWEFRTSLFPQQGGAGFYLLVNRAMQEGSGARLGDTARFRLRADLEPRPAELPDELGSLLDGEPKLRAWYNEFSESARREIGKWIQGANSDEKRFHRAEQMAERLMLAMEGEEQLPPVIERAFRERPKARAGWKALTLAQRRSELLAVFYYQSPEARERRVQKLCDLAEARAGRKAVVRLPGDGPQTS